MGGSQKVTNDDEGGGGGVSIPPKNDDVIYEQPLIVIDWQTNKDRYRAARAAKKFYYNSIQDEMIWELLNEEPLSESTTNQNRWKKGLYQSQTRYVWGRSPKFPNGVVWAKLSDPKSIFIWFPPQKSNESVLIGRLFSNHSQNYNLYKGFFYIPPSLPAMSKNIHYWPGHAFALSVTRWQNIMCQPYAENKIIVCTVQCVVQPIQTAFFCIFFALLRIYNT